jgi:hypothetical protein
MMENGMEGELKNNGTFLYHSGLLLNYQEPSRICGHPVAVLPAKWESIERAEIRCRVKLRICREG